MEFSMFCHAYVLLFGFYMLVVLFTYALILFEFLLLRPANALSGCTCIDHLQFRSLFWCQSTKLFKNLDYFSMFFIVLLSRDSESFWGNLSPLSRTSLGYYQNEKMQPPPPHEMYYLCKKRINDDVPHYSRNSRDVKRMSPYYKAYLY